MFNSSESDFLLKTKSGYWYEAEIKISFSDFKADFKKKEKHQILENGFKIWKSWKYNPLTKEKIEQNFIDGSEIQGADRF